MNEHTVKFGITTFLESGVNPKTGMISHKERLKEGIAEIVKADQVGLDFYGIGEHHRSDFAASAPAVILAAAATLTKQIILSSAVSIISSDDPIRVYQQFSTLDLISNGRAEIMAGRGSFIESFPLFNYQLDDYDQLFTDKLGALLEIRDHVSPVYKSKFANLNGKAIYPRSFQDRLKVSIAVGGTQSSIIKAAKLGLPIVFAIIGGNPLRFKPLIDLYRHVYKEHGHNMKNCEVSIHVHGFIGEDLKQSRESFYPPYADYMNQIGRERGWNLYNKESFERALSDGALFVGDKNYITEKAYQVINTLKIDRFFLHMPAAVMPHQMTIRSIEIYGNEVVPALRKRLTHE